MCPTFLRGPEWEVHELTLLQVWVRLHARHFACLGVLFSDSKQVSSKLIEIMRIHVKTHKVALGDRQGESHE